MLLRVDVREVDFFLHGIKVSLCIVHKDVGRKTFKGVPIKNIAGFTTTNRRTFEIWKV